MIIYSEKCLSCSNKSLWLKVRDFARANKLQIETRRTYTQKYREEAEIYGVDIPFVVHNGIALSLNEDFNRLLK